MTFVTCDPRRLMRNNTLLQGGVRGEPWFPSP